MRRYLASTGAARETVLLMAILFFLSLYLAHLLTPNYKVQNFYFLIDIIILCKLSK